MRFRRFCLFIVGISSAFATAGFEIGRRSVSLAAVSFLLYLFSIRGALTNVLKLRNKYGSWIYLPLGYFLVMMISNMIHDYGGGQPWFDTSNFLNYLILPIILIHSISDRDAPLHGLLGVCVGGLGLAACYYTGIGVEAFPEEGERLAIFGSNANELGIIGCFSVFVILSTFITNDLFHFGKFRWLFLGLLAAPITIILATASRIAAITLALALVAFIVFYPSSSRFGKIAIMVIGVISFSQLYQRFINSDYLIVDRLESTKEDGNLSGRDVIWKAYLSEFHNSPIIGYGETGMVGVAKKTGIIVKESKYTHVERAFSPHNVIIETLMYGGIVGFLFMFFFFYHVYKDVIKAYKSYRDLLVLFLGILIIDQILSAQLFAAKYIWMSIAYIISFSVQGNSINRQ